MIDIQDTGKLYDWALEWMMGYPRTKLELTEDMNEFIFKSGYDLLDVKDYLKKSKHYVTSMDTCFNLLIIN
jgi:hypothetical protein